MRICYACGTTESLQNGGKWECWYHNHDLDDNILCVKCNLKYFKNPRSKWMRVINERKRTIFLGKRITLSFDPHMYMKIVCSICNKYRWTALHHYFYVPCMSWACRIELCQPCHRNAHWELDTYKDQHRDVKSGRFISG